MDERTAEYLIVIRRIGELTYGPPTEAIVAILELVNETLVKHGEEQV